MPPAATATSSCLGILTYTELVLLAAKGGNCAYAGTHTALAYQPMLSSGLGCGILLLIVAAEAPSRLSSWGWREAVVACPPTAHEKCPAL